MTDQVYSLRSRGVSAAVMTRHSSVEKAVQAEDKKVEAGSYSLLFCTTEAIIGTDKWTEMLMTPPLNEQIVAIAVDETLCQQVVSLFRTDVRANNYV